MSNITDSQLIAKILAYIIENTNEEITATKVKEIFLDIVDSKKNLQEYNPLKTYLTGQTVIFENSILSCNEDGVQGSFNPAKWSLISNKSERIKNVLSICDISKPAPSKNNGDRFIVFGTGEAHADWATATNNSIVHFTTNNPWITNPEIGQTLYNSEIEEDLIYDGSNWKLYNENIGVLKLNASTYLCRNDADEVTEFLNKMHARIALPSDKQITIGGYVSIKSETYNASKLIAYQLLVKNYDGVTEIIFENSAIRYETGEYDVDNNLNTSSWTVSAEIVSNELVINAIRLAETEDPDEHFEDVCNYNITALISII